MFEEVTFERDCSAILVPDGVETTIPANTVGYITQIMGGNYTLQMANGYLVRVAGADADALGREPEPTPEPTYDPSGHIVVTEAQVQEQLKRCYDPEIPVNIVELGLVYRADLKPASNGTEGYRVEVDMTLTAPGCGMGQILIDDVEAAMRCIPGVAEAVVDLTFDPPWSPERMSDEARLELGFM